MKAFEKNLTDSLIASLLSEAKPDVRVPADADLKIRAMIRENTADYAPAKHVRQFPSRRWALPLAAAFFCGVALTVFFATDFFRGEQDQPLAWGKVLSFSGDVSSFSKGVQNRVTFGSAVTGSASFSTGSKSSCLLLLQDGSKLYLGENTSASFARLTKGSRFTAKILLDRGIVSANVRKLSKGSEFSVRAGLLNAEVRGTEFMVNYSDGSPYVSVLDGAVKVSRTDRKKASVFAHPMEKAFLSERGIGMTAISDSDSEMIRRASGDAKTEEAEMMLLGIAPAAPAEKAPEALKIEPAGRTAQKSELSLGGSLVVAADKGWVDSGIAVHSGDIVEISSSGSVTTEQGASPVGPNGDVRKTGPAKICPSAPFGSLIMSPDSGRNIIYIGVEDKFRATADGRIMFRVNDSEGSESDNRGSFTVNVKIRKK